MKKIMLFTALISMIIIGIFIGCDSDSSTGASGGGGTVTTNKIALIYDTSITSAKAYKELINTYLEYDVDLIDLLKLQITDLSRYKLLIVAPDAYPWSDTNKLKPIKISNRPILGLGQGGARLFDSLGLTNGWSNTMLINNELGIRVRGDTLSIWKTPFNLGVTNGDILTLYSSNIYSFVYLAKPANPPILLIGQRTTDTTYYHLTCDKKYFLWGFTGSTLLTPGGPNLLTETGKKLFLNTVVFMMSK